jgi:hypothetical protein
MDQEKAAGMIDPTTPTTPATRADELELEAGEVRHKLGALVGELDKRRRRLARPVLIGGTVAAVAVVATVLWRRRRRPTPTAAHLRELGAALRRAAAHPEHIARPPQGTPMLRQLGAAAAGAVVSVLAHRAAQRWIDVPGA